MRQRGCRSWSRPNKFTLSRLLAGIVLGFITLLLSCGNQRQEIFLLRQSLQPQLHNVVVLPFENYSGQAQASQVVTDLFTTQLQKHQNFQVLESGILEKWLSQKEMSLSEPLDRVSARRIGQELHVDAVFYGAVLEYTYLQEMRDGVVVAREPVVGLMARLIDVKDGSLIWEAAHSRSSYGMVRGNRDSIAEVAETAVEQMIQPLLHAAKNP